MLLQITKEEWLICLNHLEKIRHVSLFENSYKVFHGKWAYLVDLPSFSVTRIKYLSKTVFYGRNDYKGVHRVFVVDSDYYEEFLSKWTNISAPIAE